MPSLFCIARAANEFFVWDMVCRKVSWRVLRVVPGITFGGFTVVLGFTLGGFAAFHSGCSNLNLKISESCCCASAWTSYSCGSGCACCYFPFRIVKHSFRADVAAPTDDVCVMSKRVGNHYSVSVMRSALVFMIHAR